MGDIHVDGELKVKVDAYDYGDRGGIFPATPGQVIRLKACADDGSMEFVDMTLTLTE